MKLDELIKSALAKTHNAIATMLIIAVIAIIGFLAARCFTGGGSNTGTLGQSSRRPTLGTSTQDPGFAPTPGPTDMQPTATAPAQGVPQPVEGGDYAQAVAANTNPSATGQMKMTSITVYGSVNISYPESWKIAPRAANRSAKFTDGKAVLEVISYAEATDAKAIATTALEAKHGTVIAQGQEELAGYDTYWYAAKSGNNTMRIVGINGTTKIALVEQAPTSLFPTYRDVFDRIQTGVSFGK